MKNKIIVLIFASVMSACATNSKCENCSCKEPPKVSATSSDAILKKLRANLEDSQAELKKLTSKISKSSKKNFSKLNETLNSIGKSISELTQSSTK